MSSLLDYIIVGQGIAGTCFAQQLLENNKSFLIIDEFNENSASLVSAGIFNPIVLKRFTLVWKAKEQVEQLKITYEAFQNLLQKEYLKFQPMYRIFHDEDEKKLWDKKANQVELTSFLKTSESCKAENIIANNRVGKVLFTGRVDIKQLLSDFREYLKTKNQLIEARFDYNQLIIKEKFVEYKGIKAKQIVFCEGFAMNNNPFFNHLPLSGNKGEVLLVELKEPIIDNIYKSKVFVSDYSEKLNYIGATYNWDDKDINKTEIAKNFLVENFSKFYKKSYTIVKHMVGIRPTVDDRRPLAGKHPQHQRLVVFNGLGTRGIMIAPLLAKELLLSIENNIPMDSEASIRRFNSNFAQI